MVSTTTSQWDGFGGNSRGSSRSVVVGTASKTEQTTQQHSVVGEEGDATTNRNECLTVVENAQDDETMMMGIIENNQSDLNHNKKDKLTTESSSSSESDSFAVVDLTTNDDDEDCSDSTDQRQLHHQEAVAVTTTASVKRKQTKLFWLTLSSNVWFMIGSLFYVWLAVIDLEWEKKTVVVDIPTLSNEDDSLLRTTTNHSFVGVDDDDDEYIVEAGSTSVTKSQIVHGLAALAFVFTGIIDLLATQPGILGLFLLLAGVFGLVSAFLEELDEHLSNVFNTVSVHLFVLEAIDLLSCRTFSAGGAQLWMIRFGDVCFLVAACLDVGLAYADLLDSFNVRLARLEIGATTLWLTSALIYIGATLYGWYHGGFDVLDDDDDTTTRRDDEQGAQSDVKRLSWFVRRIEETRFIWQFRTIRR